jgi:hypothetical protein
MIDGEVAAWRHSWFPRKPYLFALGQVFNTNVLHVAFGVEVIKLDIAGHLRDGQGSFTRARSTPSQILAT